MPTEEYATLWYPDFGVSQYHNRGIHGESVSIYLIDVGLQGMSTQVENVKVRTPAKATGSKHGSFVGSIVAAKPVAGSVPGIAYKSQVYLSDVGNAEGTIYTSYLVSAIKDATDLNVDIISISLGTSVYDQALEDAVTAASKRGILVFAAAGNCSCRTYEFPAACDKAISVGSVTADRSLSAFNTRNDAVALFAPGQGIVVPSGAGRKRLSGTSFAVPFAAGLAALVLSANRKTHPGVRLSRESMIKTLRGPDHLGLDCTRHSYANMVSSCALVERLETPEASSVAPVLALGLVAVAAVAYAVYTKHTVPVCSMRPQNLNMPIK